MLPENIAFGLLAAASIVGALRLVTKKNVVHRIGRTGRAQNVGDAFTLMNGEELPALQAIEHFIGQKIPRLKLESFPYLYTALFEPESTAGGKRAIGGGRTHRGYSFGRRRR